MDSDTKRDSACKPVVIYSEAFLPNIGGGENYCLDLARSLTDLGESVTVITPIQSQTKDSFNFNLIRMRAPLFVGFNVNFIEPFLLIARKRPKIVIFSGPAISDFAMIPILRLLRIPVIMVFHGQFNNKWARALMTVIAPSILRFSHKVLVQTVRDSKYLKNLNVPTSKIVFLNFNGVDREKFKCPQTAESHDQVKSVGSLRFIFVGGLSSSRPYKGIDLLLEIFKNIEGSDIKPTPELIIVGGGDLLHTLVKQTKNFKNIKFLGYCSDDELIRQLCLSDVFILPSKSEGEGLGKVVLEAESCGKTVMVSKYAGISEMVESYKSGLIFDPFDIDGTIKIIGMLNSHRELLKKFSLNGERMIIEEGLDLITTAKKHILIFNEVRHSIRNHHDNSL